MAITRLHLIGLLIALAVPARGYRLDSGIRQTWGTNNYRATSFSADFGDDFHYSPSYSQYSSDTSSGTFRTYAMELAYDTDNFGLSASGGVTPRVAGYASYFWGLHGTLGRELNDDWSIDLGGGYLRTVHDDEFQIEARGRRNGREFIIRRPASFTMTQNDASLSASVGYRIHTWSVEGTRSFYDKDLAQVSARSSQVNTLAGINASVQGFPKSSAYLKWKVKFHDVFKPYVTYTRTVFEINQPHSSTYGIGFNSKIREIWDAGISYQRYVQSGSPPQDYYKSSLSVALDP